MAAITWPKEVIGRCYTVPGTYGDFAWEAAQKSEVRVLWIYNGTVEGEASSKPGSGSSVMRPWNPKSPLVRSNRVALRSFAIPTFSHKSGAFTSMDAPGVRMTLTKALLEFRKVVVDGQYDVVVFPQGKDGLFGTRKGAGVGKDVRQFITRNLPMYCQQMDGSWGMGF